MTTLGLRTVWIGVAVLVAGACVEDERLGEERADINGGTPVPSGQLEAVGLVLGGGACTGTLVSDTVVLAAAHCVCDGDNVTQCDADMRGSFIFQDVRPVSGGARTNITISGGFVVHPDFGIGADLSNDLAMLRLDQPASSLAIVSPITMAGALPAVGSLVNLVGYGPRDSANGDCSLGVQVKHQATTAIDQIVPDGTNDLTLIMFDDLVHTCKGDSGGPAIDGNGRVTGVASSSDLNTLSKNKAVANWSEWLGMQGQSRGGRVDVWDLNGASPATSAYQDIKPDPSGLLGRLDANDSQLVGSFRGLTREQVLYVDRAATGTTLASGDYFDGIGPTQMLPVTTTGLDGWLDSNDLMLVGDFTDVGHDQLLLLNRSGSGGRVKIVDLITGFAISKYDESYGQHPDLNGWHDADDVAVVGDFLGLGYDQVLFINRSGVAGRMMIAGFRDGVPPIQRLYDEAYSDGVFFNGWHDVGDLVIPGNFRGLTRDQVLFVNRGPGDGRVLIADFGDGTFPAEWLFYKTYAQATVLAPWLDATNDVQLAGDFRGVGRDQLALVNSATSGLDRIAVADLSGANITLPFVQNAVTVSGILQRAQASDVVRAGRLRGQPRAQLLTLERLEQ